MKLQLLLTFILIVVLTSCDKNEMYHEKNDNETAQELKANSPIEKHITPHEMIRLMGRGTNMGNTLEPPYEGDWALPAKEHYFDDYKAVGYQTVRIPVRWDNHMQKNAPYKIDKQWFKRVEQCVDWSLERGFITIINSHHDDWIKNNYNQNKERFKALWTQVSDYFKDKPQTLLFEIINEPHGMTVQQSNEIQHICLDIIRKKNPNRITIITGPDWAHYTNLINETVLPKDPNLIATFHYYDPWSFAGQFQGTWGTKTDIKKCKSNFDKVEKWASKHNIPVLLGEFGVRREADHKSRMIWYETVADNAISHGMAFTVWDDGGWFQVYDRAARSWDQNVIKRIIKKDDTQAPTAPSNLVYSINASNQVTLNWKASTDNVGVKEYKVYVDGQLSLVITNTSTQLYGLSAGKHEIYVTATDAAGHESAKSNSVKVDIIVKPDNEAPSKPMNLQGTVTGNSVELRWKASTDNIGVTGYKVYQDNQFVQNTSSTGLKIAGLPAGNYQFQVSAFDAAGNESKLSNQANVTIEAQSNQVELIVVRKSQWHNGFTSELKILNNVNYDISMWKLVAETNFEIQHAWNCQVNSKGKRHEFKCLNWNKNIPKGQSITIGFNGMGQLTNGSISSATINGIPVKITYKQ
ncbi:MAG: cellulase family glycosylhydrolase [Bacteroidales bacterium]|nr:cellulase family glycosylhydrolase [Bacteroidales bacterium]